MLKKWKTPTNSTGKIEICKEKHKPKYYPSNPILERQAIKIEVLKLAKHYIYLDDNINDFVENCKWKRLNWVLAGLRSQTKKLLKLTGSPTLRKLYKIVGQIK